jgi:hypothetical protein
VYITLLLLYIQDAPALAPFLKLVEAARREAFRKGDFSKRTRASYGGRNTGTARTEGTKEVKHCAILYCFTITVLHLTSSGGSRVYVFVLSATKHICCTSKVKEIRVHRCVVVAVAYMIKGLHRKAVRHHLCFSDVVHHAETACIGSRKYHVASVLTVSVMICYIGFVVL